MLDEALHCAIMKRVICIQRYVKTKVERAKFLYIIENTKTLQVSLLHVSHVMIKPVVGDVPLRRTQTSLLSYRSLLVMELSHLMRLWYFSSSVNSFFKRAEASAWPSGYCSRLLITGSRVRIPLEVRFFPNLNGGSLHRAFHVHPSIVSKWLKYCWRDVKH